MNPINYKPHSTEPQIAKLKLENHIEIKGQTQYDFVWLFVFFKSNGLKPKLFDIAGHEVIVREVIHIEYSVQSK